MIRLRKSAEPQVEPTPSAAFPLRILREAIRAVPEVKWALAVVGVIAAISIVKLLGVSWVVAVIGTVVMLILMMGLVIFAWAARQGWEHNAAVSKTFVWFAMLTITSTTISVFGSAVLNRPWPIRDWINSQIRTQPIVQPGPRESYKHTFKFAEFPLPFKVSRDDTKDPSQQYQYGYTGLAFDKAQAGRLLSVNQIKIALHITNNKNWLCCEVRVYIGDSPFKSNAAGFRGVTLDPHRVGEMMGPIPVTLKLVLAQDAAETFPTGLVNVSAEYEFPGQVAHSNLKTTVNDSSSAQFSLDKGVYAQVFVLTDFLVANRPTDFDVNRLELEVEGFTDPSL